MLIECALWDEKRMVIFMEMVCVQLANFDVGANTDNRLTSKTRKALNTDRLLSAALQPNITTSYRNLFTLATYKTDTSLQSRLSIIALGIPVLFINKILTFRLAFPREMCWQLDMPTCHCWRHLDKCIFWHLSTAPVTGNG